MREVDVDAEGVKGAKNFFEAKVPLHCASVTPGGCIFSVEIFRDRPNKIWRGCGEDCRIH